jgi:hypothetical protein
MAYINFEILESKQITPLEYLILQCCKQMKTEDVSKQLIELCGDEEPIINLEQRDFVQFVKGKAKDNFFQKARLSARGTELMDLIETPFIIPEDVVVWDWLSRHYEKEGKEVGNAKKGKIWLASFRANSGIAKNHLVTLCLAFTKDEAQMEYSKRLDYVFFKPDNVFTTRFELDSSKLWRYYLKRKDYFNKVFEDMTRKELEKEKWKEE